MSLSISVLILVLTGCRQMPKPPVAADPGAADSTIINYAKAEDAYAERFFTIHDKLFQKINSELSQQMGKDSPADRDDLKTCLSNDGQLSLYVTQNNEVRLHRKGTSLDADETVFAEKDPAFKVRVYLSSSGKYFFIQSYTDETTECHILQTDSKDMKPVIFQERIPGHWYTAEHFGGNYFWIISNQFAPNRKLFVTPVAVPGTKGWNTAIMANDSIFLEGFRVLDQKYLALIQRKNQTISVQITELFPSKKEEKKVENKISFTEPEGRISDITFEPEKGKMIFLYSSMKSPETCFSYDIKTQKLGIRWRKQIKGYDPENYKAEVFSLPRKDASPIVLSLLHHINMVNPDNQNPLLIVPLPFSMKGESFIPAMISLLDRGFYIAYVHDITDPGKDPKGSAKDLYEVAQYFINKGITSKGLISLFGVNSGAAGVIMAAAEHPEIFKSVVAENPIKIESSGFRELPAMFIKPDQASLSPESLESVRWAAKIRKDKNDKNILLIQTKSAHQDGNSILPYSQPWTFMLSIYGDKFIK